MSRKVSHYIVSENQTEYDFHRISSAHQPLLELQNFCRDFNLHTSEKNFAQYYSASQYADKINQDQFSDSGFSEYKENVNPNKASRLQSSIKIEINTTENCDELNKGEYFEYELQDAVVTSQQLSSDTFPESAPQKSKSRKRKRNSDNLTANPDSCARSNNHLISENIEYGSDSRSSYGFEICDEHRQEILDVFRSCQPNIECDAIEIEDNIAKDFVLEETTLKIRRYAYNRIFNFHAQMARNVQSSWPMLNNDNACIVSIRRRKIKAGIEEAVGSILEKLQNKLLVQSMVNRLYLRDLLKTIAVINIQDES